jgi:hypothetical protein
MAEKIVIEGKTVVFFKEQLEKAMQHQKVSTSAFTECYLVNLLAGSVHGEPLRAEPGYEETPLALLYVRALAAASRHERARLLRAMGDTALFVSGFFSESLSRKLVDLDYYRAMGGHAYARLSTQDEPFGFGSEVFSELADRFVEFADLLSEVSETSQLTSNASLLRLYERWAMTGSRRAASLLNARGIVPIRSGAGTPQ